MKTKNVLLLLLIMSVKPLLAEPKKLPLGELTKEELTYFLTYAIPITLLNECLFASEGNSQGTVCNNCPCCKINANAKADLIAATDKFSCSELNEVIAEGHRFWKEQISAAESQRHFQKVSISHMSKIFNNSDNNDLSNEEKEHLIESSTMAQMRSNEEIEFLKAADQQVSNLAKIINNHKGCAQLSEHMSAFSKAKELFLNFTK